MSDPELDRYVAELRAAARQRAADKPAGPELFDVADLHVPGDPDVPVRLYRPVEEPRELLVYFHGGGWTIGDLETHDRLCRRIAAGSDVAVLAVDYRRAPEHPWPAALDDAVQVVRWAQDHAKQLCGAQRIAVGGDSAGGAVATLTCLLLRDAGDRMPWAQVLVCPNTDLTFSRPSVRTKATGWGLTAADALWFAEQWVPDPSLRAHPRVSPLLEPDLAGLPQAVVLTAEHDPLRDEGDDYATALAAAGVPVVHRCEPGLVHGFLGLDTVSPAAAAAAERYFADVRTLLCASA